MTDFMIWNSHNSPIRGNHSEIWKWTLQHGRDSKLHQAILTKIFQLLAFNARPLPTPHIGLVTYLLPMNWWLYIGVFRSLRYHEFLYYISMTLLSVWAMFYKHRLAKSASDFAHGYILLHTNTMFISTTVEHGRVIALYSLQLRNMIWSCSW